MLITNRLGLPEPLVKAVTRPPKERVPNRIGITDLLNPPQLRALMLKHEDELTEDASERIFALLGQLLHGVLERNAEGLKDHIAEEKLTMEILGWTVVGKYDLNNLVLDGGTLTDWKLTSVYQFKDKEVKPEWTRQLNCYVELLRRNKYEVAKAQIVAIGRDWSRAKALRESDYPQEQVKPIPIEIWPREETTAYLEERVRLHQEAEGGAWPECTDEDTWARPSEWALMKKGRKKAVKLFIEKETAEKWLDGILGGDKSHYIVKRDGQRIRCQGYCPVAEFCDQWKKYKGDRWL